VALVAALVVAAVVAVLRLRPDASFEGLFPRGSPSGAAVVRVLNDFAVAEELLVLVSVPEGHASATNPLAAPPPERLLWFARQFEDATHADPALASMAAAVVYRADPQTQQFFEREVVPAGLYYLDDASFAEARRRLTPEAMREQLRRNEAALSAPGPAAGALAKTLLKDPLRLHEFLIERFAGARELSPGGGSGGPFAARDAPFLSRDGRSLLIRIPGARPPSNLDFTKAFTAGVARVADSVNRDGLEIRYAGSYAIAAASERAIRGDAIASSVTSFVYLGALFFLAYRSPLKLFSLAFGPVLVGVLLGFGAYAAGSPFITPMTAVLGAMLAEMGINYTIHYLALYDLRRAAGDRPADAAAASSRDIALPLLAAWCTSVVGFVAVGLSSLRILRDFAILGTLTLLGAVAMTMLLLPALLVLLDRRPAPASSTGAGTLPLTRQRFAFTPALHFLVRRRRLLVTTFALLFATAAVVAALPGERLPLETDLTSMHPKPNPALDTQTEIAGRFGSSPQSLVVYLEADDPEQLVALAHEVDRRLTSDAARSQGVAGTFGLATLLPDPRAVAARAAAIDQGEADRTVAAFRSAVADSPFDPAAYEPYARFLRMLLARRSAPTTADLLKYPSLASLVLPRRDVEEASVRGDNGRDSSRARPHTAITVVLLDRPIDDRSTRGRVVDAVRSALRDLPGATLTGISVVSHDAEAVVHRDLPLMLAVGTGVVALYLLAHFRSIRDTALVLLPTAFSVLCLLALMRLGGLKLNMVNLVAAPLLIGINIDYGIFLVSLARSAQRRGASADELVEEIGMSCHALVVCALTTVLGFGSLVFMAIPAVRSLGVAVSVGVTASIAATVMFLAPLLVGQGRIALYQDGSPRR